APVGALPEANRRHLRERADGLAVSAPNALHAGDEGGGNGAESGEHHPDLAGGRPRGRAHALGGLRARHGGTLHEVILLSTWSARRCRPARTRDAHRRCAKAPRLDVLAAWPGTRS